MQFQYKIQAGTVSQDKRSHLSTISEIHEKMTAQFTVCIVDQVTSAVAAKKLAKLHDCQCLPFTRGYRSTRSRHTRLCITTMMFTRLCITTMKSITIIVKQLFLITTCH